MSVFSKIFGGASSIVDSLGGIIDRFKISPQEKQQFKLELESLLQKRDSEIEQTYRKEVEAKAGVIKAELQQGDNYTKRARPTVIYTGLIFIFINYVVYPALSKEPSLSLPEEFWWAWGGIVSTYSIGRSFEKTGHRNRITGIITGNQSSSTLDEIVKG